MKRRRRLVPSCDLRVDTYRLVSEAIEEGIAAGWRRAHKHTDAPEESFIKCEIENAIMNRLSEVFIWPDRY